MRQGLATLFVLCVEAAAVGQEQPAAPQYLPPETFFSAGRPAEFLPHAGKFLQLNPQDARAPRVALDILMFATAMQDQEGQKDAKLRLLMDYGNTLPAAYLNRTSKPDDLRGLLKAYFTGTEKPLDQVALKRFHGAVMNCYRTHGPILADDELWAQAALSAEDATIAANCRQQIKKGDSDAAKLLDMAFDADFKSRDKFVRLQGLKEFKTARAWQAHLFAHGLSEKDRSDAGVQTVVVENLLADQKFAAALEILDELAKSSTDPKLQFWRGWAQAATEQVPAAISTLSDLAKNQPKSPWAASAKELAEALSSLAANLEEHTKALERVCLDLQQHAPEVVELEAEWGETPAERASAYAGLDFAADGIELFVRKASQPLAGYSSGAEGSRFFVEGDTNIHRFAEKGATPVLNLQVSPAPKGYAFSFNFNFSAAPGGLRSSIDSLLSSPAFLTPEARQAFVRHQLKAGAFPAKVVTVEGQRSFRWLFPQADKPELQVAEICLTENNRLASLSWANKVKVQNIRYGSRKDVALKSPKWPALAVSEGKEMGATEIFRLMGVVMQLLETEKPATAAKPGTIRR